MKKIFAILAGAATIALAASAAVKWGDVHPRRAVADVVRSEGFALTNDVPQVDVGPTIAAALGEFAATGKVLNANYAYSADSALSAYWLNASGNYLKWGGRWGHSDSDTGTNFYPFAYLSDITDATNAVASAVASSLATKADTATVEEQFNLVGNSIGDINTAIEEAQASITMVTNDNAQTRAIVTTWENFLDGSNVVFSITNYISGTYSLDSAKLTIKELRDGAYREVYNSRDEILLHLQNFRDTDLKDATNQVAAAVENKADKDWGKYTSAGGEAPSNTVYMTAPNTVFAGGLEYERVAVGEGTVCVLTTRGAPVWTQGDEGTFKFQDDSGTNYFGFAKTDSYVIGANADGITVQNGMVTMNYNIIMSGRPCIWYKADLTSGADWEQLNLPNGSPVAGASHVVTWEQNPPADSQVCYINVGDQPQGYFRATVEVAGEAKFMTNMPADLSGGIICPNTATGVNGVIKPTYNGSSVTWTWSAM